MGILKEIRQAWQEKNVERSVNKLPEDEQKWWELQLTGEIAPVSYGGGSTVGQAENQWYTEQATPEEREQWQRLILGENARGIQMIAQDLDAPTPDFPSLVQSREALFDLFQSEALSPNSDANRAFQARLDLRKEEKSRLNASFNLHNG